jgi:hypothetical protein
VFDFGVCLLREESVLRAGSEVDVHEGAKPFHLDCYLLYKHRRAVDEAEAGDSLRDFVTSEHFLALRVSLAQGTLLRRSTARC